MGSADARRNNRRLIYWRNFMEQPQQREQQHEDTDRCYWHSDVETGLSCSRCGKHICPQCMVQAPVGIRCKECGKSARMPTYDVQAIHYVKAVAVSVVAAVAGGALWWVADLALTMILNARIPMVTALLAVPLGYGVGELTSWAVNRKRGTGLAWIAGSSVAVAFLIYLRLPGPFFGGLFGLLFVALGVLLAIQRVRR